MEKDSKGKKRVHFDEDTNFVEKPSKKNQEPEVDQQQEEEEEDGDVKSKAEQSRRKKRRLLANVDSDSSSHEGYEGEERPDERVFEEEWTSGITLEAFNMHEEVREGVVDVYSGEVNTKNAKEEQEDEVWLKEYDSNMKDDAYVTKIEKLREKWVEDEANYENDTVSFSQVESIQLIEIVSELLLWGETVGKALNRLRPKEQKKTKTAKKVDAAQEETPFDVLTNNADKLINAEALVEIYSMTKEDLLDHLDMIKSKIIKWEYKWPQSDEVYGPYRNDEMKGWLDEGYFNLEEGKNILVRKIIEGTVNGDFIPLLDNIF